jgi:hypothetical protein
VIDCPDCGNPLSGRKCSCGYVAKSRSLTDAQKLRLQVERAAEEARHTSVVSKWLLDKGIVTSDMNTPQIMKAMAAYRNEIRGSQFGQADHAWAYDIVRQHEDGRQFPRIALANARSVIAQDGNSATIDDWDE